MDSELFYLSYIARTEWPSEDALRAEHPRWDELCNCAFLWCLPLYAVLLMLFCKLTRQSSCLLDSERPHDGTFSLPSTTIFGPWTNILLMFILIFLFSLPCLGLFYMCNFFACETFHLMRPPRILLTRNMDSRVFCMATRSTWCPDTGRLAWS